MNLLSALGGGLLIGAAVVVLYAGLGRIAGISGITFGTVWGEPSQRQWQVSFLGGLVLGGWLAAGFGLALTAPAAPTLAAALLLVASGLLTGIGTRLGGGCTSGHGVCGAARGSPRSLLATGLFMAIGMATATLLRPLLV